jgi:hypothetical protein
MKVPMKNTQGVEYNTVVIDFPGTRIAGSQSE